MRVKKLKKVLSTSAVNLMCPCVRQKKVIWFWNHMKRVNNHNCHIINLFWKIKQSNLLTDIETTRTLFKPSSNALQYKNAFLSNISTSKEIVPKHQNTKKLDASYPRETRSPAGLNPKYISPSHNYINFTNTKIVHNPKSDNVMVDKTVIFLLTSLSVVVCESPFLWSIAGIAAFQEYAITVTFGLHTDGFGTALHHQMIHLKRFIQL